MLKVKDKERIIEAARERKSYIQGSPHKIIRFFSINFLEGKSYSKCWKKKKKKKLNQEYYLATVIQDWKSNKEFSRQGKLTHQN